ncbi:hypothetical protein [Geoalkalibacter halelectricus]|uniref:hypothetical protein n=1 Tax=Geoalkalibacter halelectricus TaxID=2847045 RepID=UPI003D20D2C2
MGYNKIPYMVLARERKRENFIINKKVLEHYVEGFQESINKKCLPESIRGLFKKEFERIEGYLNNCDIEFFDFKNDLFLKDFNILRFKLIPVGAELVDVYGGVPKSIIFRGGPGQLGKSLLFFGARKKGFFPYYQLHLDPRNLRDFNPEGWRQTYLRLADLLKCNSEMRGVLGASWFYDPGLADVSPHLTYLREVREKNGAIVLYWGESSIVRQDALSNSSTRRQLFEDRKYLPQSYFVIWGRREIIRWAENEKVH